MPETIKYLAISKIRSWMNVRETVEIEALTQSLIDDGQKVPIRVYQNQDGYVLIAGHRRVEAAKKAGWTKIQAIVEPEPADTTALIIDQIVENEQRQSLSYFDKAAAFVALKEAGMKQTAIAAKFGLSDAEVSLAIASTKASPKLREAVNAGKISPSAVEPLLSLSLEEQDGLAAVAIQTKTVRGIEKLVRAHRLQKDMGSKPASVASSDNGLISDDIDPLDIMTYNGLKTALGLIEAYSVNGLSDDTLKAQADKIIQEIRRLLK